MNRGISVAVLAFVAWQCFPVTSGSVTIAATETIYSCDDRPTDYDGGHPE